MAVVRGCVLLALLVPAIFGCGGSDDDDGSVGFTGPTLTNVVDPEPGAGNTPIRLFSRPFAAEYGLLNYFDHDVPTAPDVTNNYQLTWRGARAVVGRDVRGYDGHKGIDWLLPENTPLFAVTAGEITFAGGITAPCFLENNEVRTGLTVALQFVASDGQTYRLIHAHLNRIDVAVGDQVAEGEQIGLSGVTGCVGLAKTPHLHFELHRIVTLTPLQSFVIDPYGWEGSSPDPWAVSDPQRASQWFWKQGQAPDMVLP